MLLVHYHLLPCACSLRLRLAGKGWDPTWDKPRLSTVPPAPKGHKHDHRLGERLEKIQRALANQDQRVADFQKTRPAKRIRTGFRLVMKKNPWEE